MPFPAEESSGPPTSSDAFADEPSDTSQAERAGLVLVRAAIEGLADLAAGQVLDERELDAALAPVKCRAAATGSTGRR